MNYNWEDKIIVIVEDVEMNYLLLKRQLRKTNVQIIWLQNGQESVDYIREEKPVDLILMDIRMPIMDGITATRKIKELRDNVPIVIQTACAVGDEFQEAKDSGCDDYLFKPVISNELYEKIQKHI